MFQDSLSALNPVYTIGSKMIELLRLHSNMSKKEAYEKSVELLTSVGIAEARKRMKSYPHELSGGMRQRVMIAMAMSSNPKLMIADEPTTALDVTIQAQILHLIRDLQKKTGMSVIIITHDLGVVAQMCSRIAVMCGGYVVEQGSAEDIFYRPCHPYTQALIASMPKVGNEKMVQFLERNVSEDGADGLCPFYRRCRHASEECARSLPKQYEAEKGAFRIMPCQGDRIMSEHLIEVKDLQVHFKIKSDQPFSFRSNWLKAVDHVTFSIEREKRSVLSGNREAESRQSEKRFCAIIR